MIRYRRLSIDELETMQREFVLYLVTQGIEASDWEKLKETDLIKADKLIDKFSDHVFEKIVSEMTFLDLIDEHKAILIHCHKDRMSRLCLAGGSEEGIDVLAQLIDSDKSLSMNSEVLFDQVSYSQDGRNHDIYKLLNLGFTKSNGDFYKKLSLHYASIQSSEKI